MRLAIRRVHEAQVDTANSVQSTQGPIACCHSLVGYIGPQWMQLALYAVHTPRVDTTHLMHGEYIGPQWMRYAPCSAHGPLKATDPLRSA